MLTTRTLCRSAEQLNEQDQLSAFVGTLWRFPLVYICIFVVRFFLILIFRPLFRLSRQDLSYKEILFATVAGLRGSVSLILAQAVVVDPALKAATPDDVQTIVSPPVLACTSCILLTLLLLTTPSVQSKPDWPVRGLHSSARPILAQVMVVDSATTATTSNDVQTILSGSSISLCLQPLCLTCTHFAHVASTEKRRY